LFSTPSQAFSRPGEFGAESYNAPVPHSAFGGSGPMGSFSQRRSLEILSAKAYEIDEIVVQGKRFDWGESERMRAQDEIRQWAQRQAFVARACLNARSTRRPAMEHADVSFGAYLRPSGRPSVVGSPGPPAPASVGEPLLSGDMQPFTRDEIYSAIQATMDENQEWAERNTERVSEITGEVTEFAVTNLMLGGTAGIVAKKGAQVTTKKAVQTAVSAGLLNEGLAGRIADAVAMKAIGEMANAAGREEVGPMVVSARNGAVLATEMKIQADRMRAESLMVVCRIIAEEASRFYQEVKANHRRTSQLIGESHILYVQAMHSLADQIYDAIRSKISEQSEASSNDQSNTKSRRRGGGGSLVTCR